MGAPRPVRFSRDEVYALKYAVDAYNLQESPWAAHLSTARTKLSASLTAKESEPISVTVRDAVSAMEGVLGAGRVAMPPRPDTAWFARVSAQIRKYHLTAEDFVKMGRALQAKGWAPPFSFERAVFAADRLLAEYAAPVSARNRNRPAEMEDL